MVMKGQGHGPGGYLNRQAAGPSADELRPRRRRSSTKSKPTRRWEGRKGYLRWRQTLYGTHADLAAAICEDVGYDPDPIAQVRKLLRKRGLGRDPDTQLLEDVICLVFLENYFADFAAKHDDPKVISILQETWAKMSSEAHRAALSLPLGPERTLVERVLAG